MTVSQILTEPLALHDLVPASRRRERVEELLRLVGLEPRFARRYPPRILRRPTPAHRDRAGACGRAEADHLRRAGIGARRLDPFADPQPVARSAGPARARLHLRLARSGGGQAHRRPCRGDESRRASSRPPRRRRCSPRRGIPTAARCCRRSRCPTPRAKRSRMLLQGEMPSALDPPPGCRFHTRCPYVIERCRVEPPQLLGDAPGMHGLSSHGGTAAGRTPSCRPTAAFRRRWNDWWRRSAAVRK